MANAGRGRYAREMTICLIDSRVGRIEGVVLL